MRQSNKNVYVLGYFDAVHRGHRALISEGCRIAGRHGCGLYAVTFGDGFYESLNLSQKEIYLLRERREIMRALGAEVVVLPSSEEYLNKTAEEFLAELKALNPYAIVAGSDYRFGKNAAGDAELLSAFFAEGDVNVRICGLLKEYGEKISTSEIRKLLSAGEVRKAQQLLGEPFFISGTVVGGFRNGRRIGIPTANVDFERYKFIPKNGVYATETFAEGKCYPSVSSVGCHPTFNDAHVNLETHLINFDGDLYGKPIKVVFYEYLREVKTFASASELKFQIGNDIAEAEAFYRKREFDI